MSESVLLDGALAYRGVFMVSVSVGVHHSPPLETHQTLRPRDLTELGEVCLCLQLAWPGLLPELGGAQPL